MYLANQIYDHTTAFFQHITSSHAHDFAHHRQIKISTNQTKTLFQFDIPVNISPVQGLLVLVITDKKHALHHTFLLESEMTLAPNIAFNVLSLSEEAIVDLATQKPKEPTLIKLENAIVAPISSPTIHITALLAAVTTHYQEVQQITVKPQPHYELIFIEKGSLLLNRKPLTKGQLIILPPNVTYTREHQAEQYTVTHTLRFEAQGIAPQLVSHIIEVNKLIAPLLDLMYHNSTNPYISDSLLFELQTLLLNLHQQQHQKSYPTASTAMHERYEHELFEQIIQYIDESDLIALKVSDLVRQFNLSRSTLQQLFNKFKHTTPKTYINDLRLEKSRQLIRESNLSITEIADHLGYGSLQYFSRAFSKHYNISPSEYAKGYSKRL